MLKNIKDLSDLIKIDNQKDLFTDIILNVLKIIKEETGFDLDKKSIILKKNIVKVKTPSSVKFIILLHLDNINNKIKNLNQNITLEL
jgi:hypothetical protein